MAKSLGLGPNAMPPPRSMGLCPSPRHAFPGARAFLTANLPSGATDLRACIPHLNILVLMNRVLRIFFSFGSVLCRGPQPHPLEGKTHRHATRLTAQPTIEWARSKRILQPLHPNPRSGLSRMHFHFPTTRTPYWKWRILHRITRK